MFKNMTGTNETTFPHNLQLIDRQIASVQKAFENNLLVNTNTQLSKIIKSAEFLGRILRRLMIVVLPLRKNVLTQMTKSLLILLGLTAAAIAEDAGIHKKSYGQELLSLEELALLVKGLTQTHEIKTKAQRGGFVGLLLDTLDASSSRNKNR